MKAYPVVTAAEASATPYPYVFVESDGGARELHADERTYLETPYQNHWLAVGFHKQEDRS